MGNIHRKAVKAPRDPMVNLVGLLQSNASSSALAPPKQIVRKGQGANGQAAIEVNNLTTHHLSPTDFVKYPSALIAVVQACIATLNEEGQDLVSKVMDVPTFKALGEDGVPDIIMAILRTGVLRSVFCKGQVLTDTEAHSVPIMLEHTFRHFLNYVPSQAMLDLLDGKSVSAERLPAQEQLTLLLLRWLDKTLRSLTLPGSPLPLIPSGCTDYLGFEYVYRYSRMLEHQSLAITNKAPHAVGREAMRSTTAIPQDQAISEMLEVESYLNDPTAAAVFMSAYAVHTTTDLTAQKLSQWTIALRPNAPPGQMGGAEGDEALQLVITAELLLKIKVKTKTSAPPPSSSTKSPLVQACLTIVRDNPETAAAFGQLESQVLQYYVANKTEVMKLIKSVCICIKLMQEYGLVCSDQLSEFVQRAAGRERMSTVVQNVVRKLSDTISAHELESLSDLMIFGVDSIQPLADTALHTEIHQWISDVCVKSDVLHRSGRSAIVQAESFTTLGSENRWVNGPRGLQYCPQNALIEPGCALGSLLEAMGGSYPASTSRLLASHYQAGRGPVPGAKYQALLPMVPYDIALGQDVSEAVWNTPGEDTMTVLGHRHGVTYPGGGGPSSPPTMNPRGLPRNVQPEGPALSNGPAN